jgi:hypothetical protein
LCALMPMQASHCCESASSFDATHNQCPNHIMALGQFSPLLAAARELRLPEVEPTKTFGEPTTDRRRWFAEDAILGPISLTRDSLRYMFTVSSILGDRRGLSWCRVWRRTLVFENASRFHEKCLLLFLQFYPSNQGAIANSCLLLSTDSKKQFPVKSNT